MLYHHGGTDYKEAASAAAIRAKAKMEQEIEFGKRSAAETIQRVMTEIPTDLVVKTSTLNFKADRNEMILSVAGNDPLYISDNAVSQLCQRAEIPMGMYRKLIRNPETKGWGPELMAHVFNEVYKHQEERYLIRSYGNSLRGWLSTSYRRIDSRPCLDSFFNATNELGMVPVKGYSSETKVMVKCLLPIVFEPAPDEVVCFGLSWENSDYGNGAHSLRVFILRLWCTNYAIAEEGLRQIHLGKKISDNILFSEKTYRLDTETTASAIHDIVISSLSEGNVNRMAEAISTASVISVDDPRKFLENLKSVLTKGEREAIAETYNAPEVELLPPGNTIWRMSNAISLFANQVEEPERKIELMKLAGHIIPELAEAA